MNAVIQPMPEEPPAAGVQRVQMSRGELERYMRDGRPTGLLLRSIAVLKGIDAATVAKSCGIPVQLVNSIFDDQGPEAVKKGTIRRIAEVLGINLATMRFTAGQVHVLNLRNIPAFTSRARAREIARAAGLLTRNARVACLRIGNGMGAAFSRRTFVAQTEQFRVLFISGRGGAAFDLACLPSAQWVRGSANESVVRITNRELIQNIKANDLTEAEFDEIFVSTGFVWADIRVAARLNGVSKSELMQFIQSRARELDESEEVAAKRLVIENPPFLRLVETEQRVAVA